MRGAKPGSELPSRADAAAEAASGAVVRSTGGRGAGAGLGTADARAGVSGNAADDWPKAGTVRVNRPATRRGVRMRQDKRTFHAARSESKGF